MTMTTRAFFLDEGLRNGSRLRLTRAKFQQQESAVDTAQDGGIA